MLVTGDLGFRVVGVFIFIVLPVIGLVLRRKWRLEVARREEISRLLVLAAEESARAEHETLIGYFVEPTAVVQPVVVPSQRVCAVCYAPTHNRCSRCKSVHYCSGKCQIIHWRQGHKDDCHPSPAGSEINDESTPYAGNAVKHPYHVDNDGSSSTLYFRNDSVKDDSVAVDNRLHEEGSGPVSSSIPVQGTCIDDSTSDDDSIHDLSSESCESSSTFESFETVSSDSHLEHIKQLEKNYLRGNYGTSVSVPVGPKDDAQLSSSGLRVSHSDKNSVEPSTATSGFWDGTLNSSRTRKHVSSNNAKPKSVGVGNGKLPELKSTARLSKDLSGGPSSEHSPVSETVGNNRDIARTAKLVAETSLSNKESATFVRRQSPTLSSFKEPDSGIKGVAENHSTSGKVGVASGTAIHINVLASSSRANHLNRDNKEAQQLMQSHKVGFSPHSNDISGLKRNGEPVVKSVKPVGDTAIPPQVAKYIPNASVGLKSSMQKVYEQMRAPKSSKQDDGAGKNGEKEVFAYDLFVKLYHWNKVELRPCGLINCGNSCYANAVLQCLAFTPPVTAYLLQGLHSKTCKKIEWCFICEFERLVLKANELGYPQSPIGILSQIQKIGSHLTTGRQEDAHEFLRYAIETMQSICLREAGVKGSSSLEEETTLIGLTFGGYLRSKIKCTRCRLKSEKPERMMDLTVEIEDVETLEDALRRFTGTEILDGENKYHCGRCKSYEKAKKKLSIMEAPNILTIALKRFQSGKFGKLNKSIQFPEILNLAPYMRGGSDKAPIYRLYGVVVHLDIMNASFSGHYVCYVRNAQNKWFKIDDSAVKPVELEQVLNKGAYMLFYSRCSPRAPRSIRSTIVSRDLPIKVKNPPVDLLRSNGRLSTSRQRDLPTNTIQIPDEIKLTPLHSNSGVDSSSDNSSVFSSDELSTSTDTTRDSNSADEISEFIFGYNPYSRSSDLDTSSSSSSSSSSPSPQYLHSPLCNSERYSSAGGVTFLHSNTSSKQGRNLVNISSREADTERLGPANPWDNRKSGVHLRQLSRKKPAD